jgi:hypothetical protein
MSASIVHRRPLAAAAVLALASFTIVSPGAEAAPKPVPQSAGMSCPVDVHEFAAHLRAVGLTAQAANIATQLTVRDCRAAGSQRR